MSFRDLSEAALGTCVAVLGESATYMPRGGSPVTINGIYSDQHSEVDPGTNAVVTSQTPNLGVRLSDLPRFPDDGDQVVVRARTYRVTDFIEDGAGGGILMMQETT